MRVRTAHHLFEFSAPPFSVTQWRGTNTARQDFVAVGLVRKAGVCYGWFVRQGWAGFGCRREGVNRAPGPDPPLRQKGSIDGAQKIGPGLTPRAPEVIRSSKLKKN